MFSSKRKRKNDDPRPFPAWIIVLIAIGLVVVIAVLFQPTNRNTVASSEQVVFPTPDDPLLLTATAIIQQATASAQGTPQPLQAPSSNPDAIEITATYMLKLATLLLRETPDYIVTADGDVGATASAIATRLAPSDTRDPIEITATYIVKQATEQASTPGS